MSDRNVRLTGGGMLLSYWSWKAMESPKCVVIIPSRHVLLRRRFLQRRPRSLEQRLSSIKSLSFLL